MRCARCHWVALNMHAVACP
ncbi:hypothetical protein EGJ44_19020 [Ectopseudomonas oleovorans]|uniref:Uncharacterized protein n=1 Tax=Ectopseudomonas oleovorans TaxID=301 RepID=A0A3R8WWY6_ECTOL|nr:hypothetical protein EGJ44_19020 [Pseudomonas oleovorans]